MVSSLFFFSLCGFCIKGNLGSKTSNIRYFAFNFNGFCIQSSFCSPISNIRYFDSVPLDFVLRAAVASKSVKLGILFLLSVIFVLLSESYCCLMSILLVLGVSVSIALTLLINLSSAVFLQYHYPLNYLADLNW